MKKKSKLFSVLNVLGKESDEELMAKVKDGNKAAFEKLFNKYKDKIYSFCIARVRSKSVAEELSHDVFLKVYRAKESYQETHKFSTWIWTITRNTCIDYYKKKKEISLDTLYAGNESGETPDNLIADDSIDIETSMIEKAQKEVLKKCMDNLKEAQRESLTLRIFSELSYLEISENLKTTEKAVKSLINRAKKNLVECVKKCSE
jgi:RNA polymerase sigma-70 factor (ECF subfamily)